MPSFTNVSCLCSTCEYHYQFWMSNASLDKKSVQSYICVILWTMYKAFSFQTKNHARVVSPHVSIPLKRSTTTGISLDMNMEWRCFETALWETSHQFSEIPLFNHFTEYPSSTVMNESNFSNKQMPRAFFFSLSWQMMKSILGQILSIPPQ